MPDINPCITDTAFKYLGPDRVDVLLNKQIRFTQHIDLNDPLDGLPSLTLPKDVNGYVAKIAARNSGDPRINHLIMTGEIFLRIQELVDEYSNKPDHLNAINAILRKKFNNTYGVLSLSADYNNDLLWSHYADQCRGYMIEFDPQCVDFTRDSSKHMVGENEVRQVIYTQSRPNVELGNIKIPLDCIFTKPLSWEHENELRIVRRITTDALSMHGAMTIPVPPTSDGCDKNIYLFKFTPTAIRKVVIGALASDQTRSEIVDGVANDPCLAHVQVEQAEINMFGYGYIYSPI